MFDLRTGATHPVAREQAQEVLRHAPEQSWSSHAGLIANEALPRLSAETRAIAASLPAVEPAIVLDLDEHAERLLTATSTRVCLWSLRALRRESCAPRAYPNYALRPDGSLLVWQVRANGEEQLGTLRRLDAAVVWDAPFSGERARSGSLQQPCGLEIASGPTDNLRDAELGSMARSRLWADRHYPKPGNRQCNPVVSGISPMCKLRHGIDGPLARRSFSRSHCKAAFSQEERSAAAQLALAAQ
jgi:hypothetical protein